MPKIKNWTRSDKYTDKATKANWEHDNSKSSIAVIDMSEDVGTGYSVSASIYRNGEYIGSKLGMKETDNLEEAMDYARKWMKNNPNP